MREVKVAVGSADGTWHKFTVTVEEDPNYVLDDCEVREKAVQIAEETAVKFGLEGEGREIVFCHVLTIEPLDDPLNGVV